MVGVNLGEWERLYRGGDAGTKIVGLSWLSRQPPAAANIFIALEMWHLQY